MSGLDLGAGVILPPLNLDDLDEGDVITDVVMFAKVKRDGDYVVCTVLSDVTDGVTLHGILSIALGYTPPRDEE